MDFVAARNGQSGVNSTRLRLNAGEFTGEELVITCSARIQCEYLTENSVRLSLDSLAREYFGPTVEVTVKTGDIAVPKSGRQLQEEAEANPGVQKVMDTFSAQLSSVSPRKQ